MTRRQGILAASLLLGACAGYEVTLNERPLYQPKPVFTDFRVLDTNLQRCLDQTLKDQAVGAPGELRDLNCSQAGIESLAGLELFAGLQRLRLSGNQLTELKALAGLGRLTELYLDHNRLGRVPELRQLSALERLDLAGNPALDCGDLPAMAAGLSAPEHCRD